MEYSEVKNVNDAAFGDGRIAEKREIAKNMLAENLPLKLIVKLTGLSEAEIEKL